jgi:intracellular sulfur oxidation DsrE/DsrF family protein
MRLTILVAAPAAALLIAAPALAQDMTVFEPGAVFAEFGAYAPVPDADFAIPPATEFSIAFDVAAPAEEGEINRTVNSAARFINMHDAAGVEPARMQIAVVVHGRAAMDLMTDAAWAAREKGEANPTAAAIPALIDNGVRIILCGQSAAVHGISKEDLVPGVELALSAMTAHAVLQQQGYTLNPF